MVTGLMGLGLMAALGGGCVTDRIPFEERPMEPPEILDSLTSKLKIGDLFWVDRSGTTMWSMQVVVREADVNRPILAHWRLLDPELDLSNTNIDLPEFVQSEVPKSGSELRDFRFSVQVQDLPLSSCRRLELVVSGSFDETAVQDDFFSYVDREDRWDLAFARWWVWEGTPSTAMGENADRLVRTCKPATDVLDENRAQPTAGASGEGTQ